MVFVADDLAGWLVGLLADAGRKKLVTLVLGTKQQRALLSAATAAVSETAQELRPDNNAQAEHVALVIGQVFSHAHLDVSTVERQTLLQSLQAGIAAQLSVLDERDGTTEPGWSSADALGIPAAVITQKLAAHLLQEITRRGVGGGPLEPLANQLGHDRVFLMGLRLEGKIDHMDSLMVTMLAVLGQDRTAGITARSSGPRSDADVDQVLVGDKHSVDAVVFSPDGVAGLRPRGSMPRVWNLPVRNPGFTGREEMLVAVREKLVAGDRAVVQAFQGMGGVGKTQLAIEYAYRFAGAYDTGWWVNAEQAGLIGDQFAALGAALGCIQAGAGVEVVRTAVLGELRERGRWLLVFDNAMNPADITDWLPGGGGHALITTRERTWTEVAASIEVHVLRRDESVALLRARIAGLSVADAKRLAEQLGDLPLALAQAAGFMAETGLPAAQYLDLLRTRTGKLLERAAPGSSYPRSLAAATRLAADQLISDDPAAAELARLCAFLAPEPIPADLFTSVPSELSSELAVQAADPLAWPETVALLARHSLARVEQQGLVMHRLTQAILRDELTSEQAVATRERAEAILAAADPGEMMNPVTWPRWAQLIPHVLVADLAATGSRGLRRMACNACAYMLARGDTRSAHDFATNLHQQWRDRLGDDHEFTRAAATYLAWALRAMGRYAEAREMHEDTLARERRVLGEDHHRALTSATHLALCLFALGEYHAARELDEDTLARERRVLGEDHPLTLYTASNRAGDRSELGEYRAARDLSEDTLARRRRVLGEDHPDTLASVNNLAEDLRNLTLEV
jgi:hypothetical protein